MKICFPDLPLKRLVDISNQMEKIKEESLEIIEAIDTYKQKKQDNLYDVLGEALDVAQAVAGLLELVDDEVLKDAIKTHDKKLQRKYAAKGYTIVTRR